MARSIVSNPIRRENGKVFLSLQNGHVAVVDEADYQLVQGYHWTAVKPENTWYVRTSMFKDGRQVWLMMHRLLFGLEKGDRTQVDHKNHDGLNNTRENIRLATSAQNNRNRRKRAGTTSRYRGVCWQKKYPPLPWQASIREPDGPKRFLGYFLTEREAAEAYNRAAVALHGEFASLNEFDD